MLSAETFCALLLCNEYKIGDPVCEAEPEPELPPKKDEFNIGVLSCPNNSKFDKLDNKINWLVFERALIIEVDDNGDGVFDFDEVASFMLKTGRVKTQQDAENYSLWYFSLFRSDCKDDEAKKVRLCPQEVIDDIRANGQLTWME